MDKGGCFLPARKEGNRKWKEAGLMELLCVAIFYSLHRPLALRGHVTFF